MRINWETQLAGACVVLVPYCRKHVATYHDWMKDPYLLEMTASEPLALDEEYAMQKSWREDDKKLTFIVLEKNERRMAGDVNLFFNVHDDPKAAEIEIMIAEPAYRRKGLAQEALYIMMAYAKQKLGTETFIAKIGDANEPSLNLFAKIGFNKESWCEAFKETTLVMNASLQPESWSAILKVGASAVETTFVHDNDADEDKV